MAYVNLLSIIYPIGAVWRSTNNTSPANLIGDTWTLRGSSDTSRAYIYPVTGKRGWNGEVCRMGELVTVHFFSKLQERIPAWDSAQLATGLPRPKKTWQKESPSRRTACVEGPRLYVSENGELWLDNKAEEPNGELWAGTLTYITSDAPANNSTAGGNNAVYMWERTA